MTLPDGKTLYIKESIGDPHTSISPEAALLKSTMGEVISLLPTDREVDLTDIVGAGVISENRQVFTPDAETIY